MNGQTALLDVRRMGEADRLTGAAGTPVTELREKTGNAVAHAIGQRWTKPSGDKPTRTRAAARRSGAIRPSSAMACTPRSWATSGSSVNIAGRASFS